MSGESDTVNNCSDPVTISVGLRAELAVSRAALDSPFLASIGTTPIRMAVDVTNNGPGVSPPAKLSFSGGRSFVLDVPSLVPGETMEVGSKRVGTASLGTATYRVCIESASDENSENNCRSRSVTYN